MRERVRICGGWIRRRGREKTWLGVAMCVDFLNCQVFLNRQDSFGKTPYLFRFLLQRRDDDAGMMIQG